MARLGREISSALFASAVLGLAASAAAQPSDPTAPPALHLHVRGTAELRASATTEAGGFAVRGEIVDDAGSPVSRAAVSVQIAGADGAPARLGPLAPCAGATRRPRRGASADDATLETDDRGAFCAVVKPPGAVTDLSLRFAGNKLLDSVEAAVHVDAEQDRVLRTVLRIDPPAEVLDLDRTSVTVTAWLRFERSEAGRLPGASARREGLLMTLEDERGDHVAEALTAGDGRARFDVKTIALAGPGAGVLSVRFAGKPELTKAATSQPVLRSAEVHIVLTHPLEHADAEEGFPVDVEVTTSRGAVDGGVVEVLHAPLLGAPGEPVGAGPVTAGRARVIASFASGGASVAPLILRYVPAAPWYRAGAEIKTEVTLTGPGILRQALVGLVVIAAAVWIVGGWRRAPKVPFAAGADLQPIVPSGRPGLQILGPAAGASAWYGVIRDAHEGTKVFGARLRIIAPTFQGNGVIAEATTDARGEFTLAAEPPTDARLIIESPEHSSYEQTLPPPSQMSIALVTRRRALLDRLVRWARRQGAPFDAAPEPTPGHVRRVAARGSAPEVEAWARRVEAAAFSPEVVDEAIEREVRAVEPRR
jgi:hypothetical protein